jgi:hypothetical protein
MNVKTRWRARVSIGLAPERYVLNHEHIHFIAYEPISKPIRLYDLVSVNPRTGRRLLSCLSKSPRSAEWQRCGFSTSAVCPRASIPKSPESRTHPPRHTSAPQCRHRSSVSSNAIAIKPAYPTRGMRFSTCSSTTRHHHETRRILRRRDQDQV